MSFLELCSLFAGRCQRVSEDQGQAGQQQDQDRQAQVQAQVLDEEPGGVGGQEGQVDRRRQGAGGEDRGGKAR